MTEPPCPHLGRRFWIQAGNIEWTCITCGAMGTATTWEQFDGAAGGTGRVWNGTHWRVKR